MKPYWKPTAILLFSVLFTVAAHAQLVIYSFDDSLGNEVNFGPESYHPGVNAGALGRGPGVTPDVATGAFNASQWTTGSSPDPNDHFTFSVGPAAGYVLSLNRIQLDERRSTHGITQWSIRSSLDGFASDIGGVTFNLPDNNSFRRDQTIELGSEFQGLASAVEFRLYGFAAESESGSWRLDNVRVDGTLAPVPEPYEYGLVFGAGILAFGLYRRRAAKLAVRLLVPQRPAR